MNGLCKVLIAVTALSVQLYPNTVPSSVWPQKDTKEQEIGNAGAHIKILISAVSSDFKDSVIKAVADSLKSDSVYIKVIGLKKLSTVKPDDWNAIVIANTCMAWQMDNRVQNFLKAHSSYPGFIVLTTSGNPDSCGSKKQIPSNVDAISSATSVKQKGMIVERILTDVRKHIYKKQQD